jgi:hypothetical protein
MARWGIDEASQLHDVIGNPHPRCLADQHLVDDTRQAEDVGPHIQGGETRGLFGTHVPWRSQWETGPGQVLGARCHYRFGDAEIGDDSVALGQQDVLGLDVSVQHTLPVRVTECVGNLLGNRDRRAEFHVRLAAQPLAQRLAGYKRHHVIQKPRGLTRVDQHEDVGMIQLCSDLDFLEEPIGAE